MDKGGASLSSSSAAHSVSGHLILHVRTILRLDDGSLLTSFKAARITSLCDWLPYVAIQLQNMVYFFLWPIQGHVYAGSQGYSMSRMAKMKLMKHLQQLTSGEIVIEPICKVAL